MSMDLNQPISDELESSTVESSEQDPPSTKQAVGIRRVLLIAGGFLCIGMAYLGAILPGLPTTPWVLLASYCFSRSSPRLQRWLRRSPIFGRLIQDWDTHRGLRRPVKAIAIVMIVAVVSVSILSGRLPVWARWVTGGLAVCGICTITLLVPTIRPSSHGK
jgi:uncharacterized protein